MDISLSKENLLSFDEASRLLHYDPETGKLFWKVNRKRRLAGEEAGSISASSGYRVITINGKNYLQHRVAWLLHYHAWPETLIDHGNLDNLDNRIENLRLADHVKNGANRRGGKRRLMGSLKGASLSIRPGRNPVWRSSIRVKGKTQNLGSYQTELEAHQAYLTAAKAAFGEYARAA